MRSPAQIAEDRDFLAFLRQRGLEDLIAAAADPACHFRGRLSGNALARRSGIPPRRAWQMVRAARELLDSQIGCRT